MKKSCAFYLLLFFLPILNAQTPYHPMLVEGRSWDIFNLPSEQSICTFIYANHLFLSGDTILDGVSYKKLKFNRIQSDPPFPFCQGFYLDTTAQFSYYSFFREDTSARKVYIRNPGEPEYTLFDFSLQAGDTLHYPFQDFPILDVFDFQLANGGSRKAFKIGDWLDNFYIEGIGNALGAFDPVFYPFEGWSLTSCVRDGNTILLSSEMSGGPGCVLNTSATQTPVKIALEISPNPFLDHFELKIPAGQIVLPFDFELYGFMGQRVLRQSIVPASDAILINLPPLSSGLYGWAINGVMQGKLIHQ